MCCASATLARGPPDACWAGDRASTLLVVAVLGRRATLMLWCRGHGVAVLQVCAPWLTMVISWRPSGLVVSCAVCIMPSGVDTSIGRLIVMVTG